VFTDSLPRNGCLLVTLLHRNMYCCLFLGLCQATVLYATIF
jgi:hypothetical protein